MQNLLKTKFCKHSRSFQKTNFQYLPRGTVKFFHRQKGYGIIIQDSQDKKSPGREVFFHYTSFGEGIKNLHQGHIVLYELQNTPKGEQAFNIFLDPEA